MEQAEYDRAEALTDKIMEHVCGWPDRGEVFAVAAVIVQHPEVLAPQSTFRWTSPTAVTQGSETPA